MANKGMSRSLKSRQIGFKQLFILVEGSSGTPVVSGLDAAFVESITDNGVGDYTIRLKLPAQSSLVPISIVPVTANANAAVTAVDEQEITVEVAESDDGTTALDADFYLCIGFHEVKHVF